MKRTHSAGIALMAAAPLTAMACDGPTKCVSCTLRDAPRELLQMLPGFLSTHAGLIISVLISAVGVAVILRRDSEVAPRE